MNIATLYKNITSKVKNSLRIGGDKDDQNLSYVARHEDSDNSIATKRASWRNNVRRLIKKNEDQGVKSGTDDTGEVDLDFIPYACHYCADTVLTKAGDLLQLIKIDCGNIERGEVQDLRQRTRDAVMNIANSGNLDIAFCLHTVREGKDIADIADFGSKFANQINSSWAKKLKLSQEFSNSIYISILISGLRERLSPTQYIEHTALHFVANKYMKHTAKAYNRLVHIADRLLVELHEFHPRRLKVVRKDGEYYSEIINCYAKTLGISAHDAPLVDKDLSLYFSDIRLVFGHNTFELNQNHRRSFGCMMAFKEARDVSAEAIDKLLSKNHGMVLSETIEFVSKSKSAKETVKKMGYQRYIMTFGKDNQLSKDIGLESFVHYLENNNILVYRQISLMLIEKSVAALNTLAASVDGMFSSAGFMLYRHDLQAEAAYWAQLPGNFLATAHRRIIDPARIGTFCHVKPVGLTDEDYWGAPLAYMLDQNNLKAKVSIHNKGCGHTLIVGHNSNAKILMNFLITQAQKFSPDLLYIGCEESDELFIKLLGGKVTRLKDGLLTNSDVLRDFLHYFAPEDTEKLMSVILTGGLVLDEMASEDGSTKERAGVSLGIIADDNEASSYLLDRLLHVLQKVKCNAKPMLLAISNPWRLYMPENIGAKMREFMAVAVELNIAVIFLCDQMDEEKCVAISRKIHPTVVTHIFFPTIHAKERYKDLGVDDYISDWLRMVARRGSEEFLLKRGASLLALKFAYQDIKEFSLLRPMGDDAMLVKGCLKNYGDDINSWLSMLDFSD